jgi:hypothetical protein
MKILNVREGFACNSSSTHSIIFARDALSDREIGDDDFGWQNFIAASEDAKSRWLSASLRASFRATEIDESAVRVIVEQLTGVWSDGYVDHQSAITFPRAWVGHGLDLDFVKDFRDYLLNPKVAILGGNDNEESNEAPPGERVFYRSILPVDGNDPCVARKDSSGYWSVFNRTRGDRVRVAFSDIPMSIEAKKADAPELVDLKITDFCTYDCPTCYQGSTRKGAHGDLRQIYAVLANLGAARVFEVAIGGGEPTLHPNFAEIIGAAHREGVTPNFTTRDPKWFLRYMHIVKYVGAVAVSCDTRNDAERALRAIEALPSEDRETLKGKLVIQHILGIEDTWEVESLFRFCRENDLPVVLLGYKTSHRGANGVPKVPAKGISWGEWLVRLSNDLSDHVLPYHLGVDTVLAAEFKGLVPDYRLTTREGQFSCYIDASGERDNLKTLPSSFSTAEPVLFKPEGLVAAWQKISSYEPTSAYVYKRRLPT